MTSPEKLKVSLIITTYNRKETLRLALETALEQTRLPDEIIVADDGSREDTAEMIREIAAQSPVPLIHVWQPDQGFRAAHSRNNGTTVSTGDYLIFLDGDCYMNRYFIADHLANIEEKQFIVGTRINVHKTRQDYILRTGKRRISFFSWGTTKKFNAVRSPWLAWLLYKNKKSKNLASANFSLWRSDLEKINGFDEHFQGHGFEDLELGYRLNNADVRGRRIIHVGMVYHFSHPESPKCDPEQAKYAKDTKATGKIQCEVGLHEVNPQRFQVLLFHKAFTEKFYT